MLAWPAHPTTPPAGGSTTVISAELSSSPPPASTSRTICSAAASKPGSRRPEAVPRARRISMSLRLNRILPPGAKSARASARRGPRARGCRVAAEQRRRTSAGSRPEAARAPAPRRRARSCPRRRAVAGLAHLAGARGPAVEHGAQRLQQRRRPGHDLRLPSDHHDERPRLGRARAAGHRGVEEVEAGGAELRGQRPGGLGRHRRRVDHERPCGRAVGDAEGDLADLRRTRERGHDHARLARDGGGALRRVRTRGDGSGDGGRRPAVDDDGPAARQQPARDAAAHRTEAYDADHAA